MNTSPYISFQGATETRKSHPRDIQPPTFSRLTKVYPRAYDKTITWPVPTYTFPAAPTLGFTPRYNNLPITYIAFFTIGAYTVLLQANRILRWSAPGRPTVFDIYELDGDVQVLTGANYTTLPGSGALESAVTIGTISVIFDANGIGYVSLTGDIDSPFSYARPVTQITTESTPIAVGGTVFFAGTDGRIWQTSGASASALDGPLNIRMISEVTWPPATVANFAYNAATGHFILGTGTTQIWVDRDTGAYSTKPATGDILIETGPLMLGPEDHRLHIQRVRLYWKNTTGTAQIYAKGYYDTPWTTITSVTGSTDGETEIAVNYNNILPQLRFVFTGSGEVYGMVVFYDDGGKR